jgi:probable rRNA maturation factor
MILNRQRIVRIAPKPLQAFLQKVQRETHTREREVTVCFVSDAQIARWNRQYREKLGPTDVLSFPARTQTDSRRNASSYPGTRRQRHGYLGDIAIAPATARKYAKRNGRTLDSELRVLILHGVLHLLGFDHESDNGEMERLEHRLRRRLGLEN